MRLIPGILLCFLYWLQPIAASTLQVSSTYAEVIEALGEPDGDLNAGSRRILTYGQAQIKLKDGKVDSISRDLS